MALPLLASTFFFLLVTNFQSSFFSLTRLNFCRKKIQSWRENSWKIFLGKSGILVSERMTQIISFLGAAVEKFFDAQDKTFVRREEKKMSKNLFVSNIILITFQPLKFFTPSKSFLREKWLKTSCWNRFRFALLVQLYVTFQQIEILAHKMEEEQICSLTFLHSLTLSRTLSNQFHLSVLKKQRQFVHYVFIWVKKLKETRES